MKNSIILAYRNRAKCLYPFLKSIDISLNQCKSNVEIIIADLASSDNTKDIISKFKHLDIKYNYIDYDGIFWKTKALNYCVRKASGELVTMIDVDSILPPMFFYSVNEYVSRHRGKFKLAHRVRFLDKSTSNLIINMQYKLNSSLLNKVLVKRASRFKLALERFTEKEIKYCFLSSSKKYAEVLSNQALGNSHFTMRKIDYMEIGGYDEGFIGHGLEDLDFNLRAFRYLNHGTIRPSDTYTVYHLWNIYNRDKWDDSKCRENNRKIYRHNKKNNIVKLDKNDEWGIFT